MNKRPVLATALFTLASFPLLAQQSSPVPPQEPSQSAPATPSQTAEAASQSAAPLQLSPVQGELVSKLDTKTAKTGDNIVVQTKSSVKTTDGTEIPKGSKLIGHVVAVKPSEAGATSQVALQFDHIELTGGQNLAVHSQIQSISPPGGADTSTSAAAPAMSSTPANGSPSPNAAVGSNRPSSATQPAGAESTTTAAPSAPAAGTVVATNGNIAIQTTSIPGVLLANNAPGQQDPRMAQTSSILLGAKRDVQLDGGTEMVIGVSTVGGTR